MTGNLSYDDAVSALCHALKFGIDPSLEPIRKMCAAMGGPQLGYKCVQVAGSNGKSSTTRMTAALLRAHGLKVGLYTSPHLVKYPERIEVDGKVVDDRLFAEGIAAALDAAQRSGLEATEFELLTAAALWIFARAGVDAAVLECGLGGRWDATTVVDAKVAVITGVALEHTQILGDTVEAIAAEKAAIIKEGSTAVLACNLDAASVFEQRADQVGAGIVRADARSVDPYDAALGHLPGYQRINAATALAAASALLGRGLNPQLTAQALEGISIPGRFEVLRREPLLMVDAAHNPQSAQVLARELSRKFVTAAAPDCLARAQEQGGARPIPTLLLGVLADKDVRGVVRALVPLFNDVVVTASRSPRAIPPERLAAVVVECGGAQPRVVPDVAEALDLLGGTPTLATGSITVAGEVKQLWC